MSELLLKGASGDLAAVFFIGALLGAFVLLALLLFAKKHLDANHVSRNEFLTHLLDEEKKANAAREATRDYVHGRLNDTVTVPIAKIQQDFENNFGKLYDLSRKNDERLGQMAVQITAVQSTVETVVKLHAGVP